MKQSPRTLGSLVLVGAFLVSLVIAWVAVSLARDGQIGAGTAVAAAVVAMLLLVVPQVGFGVYLLRFGSRNDEA